MIKAAIRVTVLAAALASGSAVADVWVNGYTRSDGTQVRGHYRSSPNDTTQDNWSTRGNTNPYTGERGSQQQSSGSSLYGPGGGFDLGRRSVDPGYR